MKHQKTIEQNVIKFIERHNLLFGVKKIIIALSGGADSVFALHFFYKYKKKYNIKILAVHVNHNLRGKESDKDEKFCEELCKTYNVDFYSASVDVKQLAKNKKLSIEEAARILRYNELEKIAKETNTNAIVTAHNINDNTETVLLNIANGAGIDGIAGIPVKRGNIIRPFLCISKDEIKNYLHTLKIKYREDLSNNNLDFQRNYFRKKIIPLIKKEINPSLEKVILSSSEVLRNQKEVLEYFISGIINEIVVKDKTKVIVKTSKLKNYPAAVIGEIFKYIFNELIGIEYSFNNFVKLKRLIDSQTGIKISLAKKYIAVKERGKIIIHKPETLNDEEYFIKVGDSVKINNQKLTVEKLNSIPEKLVKKNKTEIISADKIKEKLTVRKWKAGDKIQPIGMKGTKKISDVLTDLKISSYKKENQFVLLNGNEIVWLIGLKLSDKYKITSTTKSAIKLCLK